MLQQMHLLLSDDASSSDSLEFSFFVFFDKPVSKAEKAYVIGSHIIHFHVSPDSMSQKGFWRKLNKEEWKNGNRWREREKEIR